MRESGAGGRSRSRERQRQRRPRGRLADGRQSGLQAQSWRKLCLAPRRCNPGADSRAAGSRRAARDPGRRSPRHRCYSGSGVVVVTNPGKPGTPKAVLVFWHRDGHFRSGLRRIPSFRQRRENPYSRLRNTPPHKEHREGIRARPRRAQGERVQSQESYVQPSRIAHAGGRTAQENERLEGPSV